MKLVEILARELDEWPEADSEYGQIESMSQAGDYRVSHYAGVRQKWRKDLDDWGGSVGDGYVPCSRFTLSELATDHATAIVTRADWEAERAKLKAPKANGDGWVRNRGRSDKNPVDAGVTCTIKFRDGSEATGGVSTLRWLHNGGPADVMRYKIHKPAEQPSTITREAVAEAVKLARFKTDSSATADTMLAIRDRIRELDTQRAEVESTYQHQISEITQERESLLHRLAGEGLALVEVVERPVGDMSDYRKWREGDLLTLVGGPVSGTDFTPGNKYKFLRVDEWDEIVVIDDAGDENGYGVNLGMFRWHSRPAS